jgi:hypothetical protein
MSSIAKLHDIAAHAGGLVTTAQAVASGVRRQRLTDLVRRGAVARVARGVYSVRSSLELPDPAALTRSWRVVLSHWSAAAWWGVDLPGAPDRVHVAAPRSRGRWRDDVAGVCLHRMTLRRGDVARLRGVPVTSPVRTAIDLARRCSLEEGVAIVDAFMRAGLMSHMDFEAAALAAQGPGRRRIQQVAVLVDPKAGSILESYTRILLWRHGLAPEASQVPFTCGATGWHGLLDFAWPTLRVALECDGYGWHADRAPFQGDRRRWSALNRAGWRSGVVTWFDVTHDPAYVVALVRDLLDPSPLARAS